MKKLKLKDLKLESFVIQRQERLGRTIRGGAGSGVDYDYSMRCNGSDYCYEPTDDCQTLGCTNYYCTDKTNCC